MALQLMLPIPARLIQVLQDFLPAELDLIDTEEADGLTTPDIPTNPNNWFPWDAKLITQFPACSIRTVYSRPFDLKPDTFGRRVDAEHRLDVMFHASLGITPGQSGLNLQKLMHRYVNGGMRVLCIMKEGLQTTADPTRWGSPNATTVCEWVDEATYGPETEQEGGAVVRTATLPVRVRRIEAR